MADSQSVMRPLPIYSEAPLTEADKARIVRAKQSLNTPILAQFARGVPGSERVLSIGGPPPFACDWAQVADTNSPGLADAVAYVLGLNDDPRAHNMSDWLSETLGAEVMEVTDAADSKPDPAGGVGTGTPAAGPDRGLQPRPIRGWTDPNESDDRNYRATLRATAQG